MSNYHAVQSTEIVILSKWAAGGAYGASRFCILRPQRLGTGLNYSAPQALGGQTEGEGAIPMKPKKKTRRTARRAGHDSTRAELWPIGLIRSSIRQRSEAPKQGSEGAPDAWLEVNPLVAGGLEGLAAGDDIIVVTWLHQACRDVLKVHPRSDRSKPLTGVFATRSPDRPNPLGLHPVTVREVNQSRLRIGPIEAIDGTPVVDIKPVLCSVQRA